MHQPTLTIFSRTRKYAMYVFFLFGVFGASPAFAKDPCKMVVCMWGLLNGETAECKSDIAEYFSVLEYKKKGKVDWNKTASKRLSLMNSCQGADSGKTKEVNDKYGKKKSG